MPNAKYKFTYAGAVYYVNREDSDYVYGHGGGIKIRMKKEELSKRFFEGLVDFGCDTKPDFIDQVVKA